MPILVTNPKDHPVHLRSFDGDSVMVGPKAVRASVANKFAWSVPSYVRVEEAGPDGSTHEGHVDPCAIVKVDTHLFMSRRPNLKGARALEKHETAKYFRDLADRKKAMRLAAKQRADLEAGR
jgi:hypothetical protein